MTDTPTAPGATPADEPETDQQEQAQDGPPAWFTEYVSKIDNRLGDMGRQLAKLKSTRNASGGEPAERAEAQPQKSEPSLSREDLDAAMRLGEMRGKLPDPVRDHLDQLAQDGVSYGEQLRLAEVAAMAAANNSATASNGQQSQTTTRGAGATPARSKTAPAHPRTQRELLALRDKDRAAYERLWDDPTFTPPSH